MAAKRRKTPADTEVDAYIFIRRKLQELGWDVRNPERNAEGQVWTQNQCLSNPHIKQALEMDRPENIVRVSDSTLYVIEAKRSQREIGVAVSEAEDYATRIRRESTRFKAPLVSGVAGNDDDGYIVQSRLYLKDRWHNVQINDIDTTGLLSPHECDVLLSRKTPNLDDPPINEALFIATAEYINKSLHEGAVNPNERAKVVSALLLSMLTKLGPNIQEKDTSILIDDVNARAKRVLQGQGKQGFEEHIRIPLPSAKDNHVKFRKALVEALQELRGLNIHSAMRSGADWLGTFYEVFLKYARWAQDLGIVLTPRHITRFAARILAIGPHDIVFDPTCGTGGFLVAAFEEVKRASSTSQIDAFKRNGVFGLEQDDGIAALAIVNMIFRGDGKNNIEQANCLSRYVVPSNSRGVRTAKFARKRSKLPPVTKVLMNPPFSLTNKEYEFVDHALLQMEHGGLLFSILPYSVMAKSGPSLTWRRKLLKDHTLLSVVTLPIDIFYPVSAPPVGIVVRCGTPHAVRQRTIWVRAETDGYLKSKGKRLPSDLTDNALERAESVIRSFLNDSTISVPNAPRFMKACPINFEDPLLELVPEAYLEQENLSESAILDGVDSILRDAAAFLIRNRVRTSWDG